MKHTKKNRLTIDTYNSIYIENRGATCFIVNLISVHVIVPLRIHIKIVNVYIQSNMGFFLVIRQYIMYTVFFSLAPKKTSTHKMFL